jgi:hypothetical protein
MQWGPRAPYGFELSCPSPASEACLHLTLPVLYLLSPREQAQCPSPTWHGKASTDIWDSCTITRASPSQGSSLNWTNGVEEEFLEWNLVQSNECDPQKAKTKENSRNSKQTNNRGTAEIEFGWFKWDSSLWRLGKYWWNFCFSWRVSVILIHPNTNTS